MLQYELKGKTHWGYFPKAENEGEIIKVSGTKASPEFMQAIAYEVYLKGVTFGNLHKWLKDIGMSISKNTLRNWLKKGKVYLDNLIPSLKEMALEKGAIVNCDETWCKVRRYNKYTKKYMWVLVNKSLGIVIFFYDEGSRGRKVLTDFLGESELQALMSGGYNAYTFLDGELENADHLICLAHLGTKLVKAANQGDKLVLWFLDMLNKFFGFEREYKEKALSEAEIYKERQGKDTSDIVKEIEKKL